MPRGRPKTTGEPMENISDIDRKIEHLKNQQQEDIAVLTEDAPKQPEVKKQDHGIKKVQEGEYSATIVTDYHSKVDPFILTGKDPNFEYRFLHKKPENMSKKTSGLLHQHGGWQLCPKEHLLRIGIPTQWISDDGHYHQGANVLAFMPKSLYKKKIALKDLEANAPMNAIHRAIKEGKQDSTVNLHETMAGKGFQTAKQLGFK